MLPASALATLMIAAPLPFATMRYLLSLVIARPLLLPGTGIFCWRAGTWPTVFLRTSISSLVETNVNRLSLLPATAKGAGPDVACELAGVSVSGSGFSVGALQLA